METHHRCSAGSRLRRRNIISKLWGRWCLAEFLTAQAWGGAASVIAFMRCFGGVPDCAGLKRVPDKSSFRLVRNSPLYKRNVYRIPGYSSCVLRRFRLRRHGAAFTGHHVRKVFGGVPDNTGGKELVWHGINSVLRSSRLRRRDSGVFVLCERYAAVRQNLKKHTSTEHLCYAECGRLLTRVPAAPHSRKRNRT